MLLHIIGTNLFLFNLFYFVNTIFSVYSLINYKELYNSGPNLLYNYFIYVTSFLVVNGILSGIWVYKISRFIKYNYITITNSFLIYISFFMFFLNLGASSYSIYYKTLFDKKSIEFYEKSYQFMWYNFNILYYYNLIIISNFLLYILFIITRNISNKLFNYKLDRQYNKNDYQFLNYDEPV
jgi:hypothetical protein